MNKLLYILLLFLAAANIHAQDYAGSDSLMAAYLQREGIAITHRNKVKLLPSGKEKFDDLFSAIRSARHHIHLEYFNFRNDSIATELFTLLSQKAEEGVKVRALFDAFGNWSNNRPLTKRHLRRICNHNIEIVKFDPITFPWINHAGHRDHRKIVVIDGKVGYTGGMNIADYYIHGLPEVGDWRDMHARIEGDAVRYLQGVFLNMWNHETRQHIGGPEYFAPTDATDPAMTRTIAIVDRRPRVNPKSIRHAYIAAIDAATERVRIINPYFTPTPSIRKALKRALKRGTEVELLIPNKADIPLTPEVGKHIGHKLMKRGAKVYLFNNGFHHTKVLMADSLFCTVGSANLNSRSLRYDYEVNAFILDPGVTRQLNDLFDRELKQSIPLTPEYWKKRSVWKKFVGWFGNLLTPLI